MTQTTTIGNLPRATTPLSGSELVPVEQGGATKSVAVSAIGGGGGTPVLYAEAPSSPTAPTVTAGSNGVAIGDGAVVGGTGIGQMAFGFGATTSGAGDNTVAIGLSYASGLNAISMINGDNSVAFGAQADKSIAIGYHTFITSGGVSAIAIGEGANVTDYPDLGIFSYQAICFGQGNATGIGSVAFQSSNVFGDYSVAIGFVSSAYGSGSTSLGFSSFVSGDFSLAIGNSASVAGVSGFDIVPVSGAIAIGHNSVAQSNNSISIGTNSFAEDPGQVAFNSNSGITRMGDVGNCQASTYLMFNFTSGYAPSNLYGDGLSSSISLKFMAFSAKAVALNPDNSDYAAFETSLPGVMCGTLLTNATWKSTVGVSALSGATLVFTNTGGELTLTAHPPSGYSGILHWSARVDSIETSNA